MCQIHPTPQTPKTRNGMGIRNASASVQIRISYQKKFNQSPKRRINQKSTEIGEIFG